MSIIGDHSWSQTFRGREAIRRDLCGYVAEVCPGAGNTTPSLIQSGRGWVIAEMKKFQDSTTCEHPLRQ